MALKKLNKSEVSALANKIKGIMRDTNDEVKRQAIAKALPQMKKSASWIKNELDDLSPNARGFIDSITHYNKEISKDDIMTFLESRETEKVALVYTEPEESWRGANKIEEAIVLAQLEADSVDALITAVKTAFTGGK
jgi:hypothetical protein